MGLFERVLSFTVVLSEPEASTGGALVLESPGGEESFRLPAGHALGSPSTYSNLLRRWDA